MLLARPPDICVAENWGLPGITPRAGLDTLAVRVPSLDLARSLLRACRFPVAAPSANASGHISPTTADHVSREFGSELAVILDGGPSQIGFGVLLSSI